MRLLRFRYGDRIATGASDLGSDTIRLLPISRRVDYEGELAVVIGRLARNVKAEDAGAYVLGYTCANDVTLRDLQKTDEQWARAKGFDGSSPAMWSRSRSTGWGR